MFHSWFVISKLCMQGMHCVSYNVLLQYCEEKILQVLFTSVTSYH